MQFSMLNISLQEEQIAGQIIANENRSNAKIRVIEDNAKIIIDQFLSGMILNLLEEKSDTNESYFDQIISELKVAENIQSGEGVQPELNDEDMHLIAKTKRYEIEDRLKSLLYYKTDEEIAVNELNPGVDDRLGGELKSQNVSVDDSSQIIPIQINREPSQVTQPHTESSSDEETVPKIIANSNIQNNTGIEDISSDEQGNDEGIQKPQFSFPAQDTIQAKRAFPTSSISLNNQDKKGSHNSEEFEPLQAKRRRIIKPNTVNEATDKFVMNTDINLNDQPTFRIILNRNTPLSKESEDKRSTWRQGISETESKIMELQNKINIEKSHNNMLYKNYGRFQTTAYNNLRSQQERTMFYNNKHEWTNRKHEINSLKVRMKYLHGKKKVFENRLLNHAERPLDILESGYRLIEEDKNFNNQFFPYQQSFLYIPEGSYEEYIKTSFNDYGSRPEFEQLSKNGHTVEEKMNIFSEQQAKYGARLGVDIPKGETLSSRLEFKSKSSALTMAESSEPKNELNDEKRGEMIVTECIINKNVGKLNEKDAISMERKTNEAVGMIESTGLKVPDSIQTGLCTEKIDQLIPTKCAIPIQKPKVPESLKTVAENTVSSLPNYIVESTPESKETESSVPIKTSQITSPRSRPQPSKISTFSVIPKRSPLKHGLELTSPSQTHSELDPCAQGSTDESTFNVQSFEMVQKNSTSRAKTHLTPGLKITPVEKFLYSESASLETKINIIREKVRSNRMGNYVEYRESATSVFPLIDLKRNEAVEISEETAALDDPRSTIIPISELPSDKVQTKFWLHNNSLTDIDPTYVTKLTDYDKKALTGSVWIPKREKWQKYVNTRPFFKSIQKRKDDYCKRISTLVRNLENIAGHVRSSFIMFRKANANEVEENIGILVNESLTSCERAKAAYTTMFKLSIRCICFQTRDKYVITGFAVRAFINSHSSVTRSLAKLRKYIDNIPDFLQKQKLDDFIVSEIMNSICSNDDFQALQYNNLECFPDNLGNTCSDSQHCCPNYILLHVYYLANIQQNTLSSDAQKLCKNQIQNLLTHVPVRYLPHVSKVVQNDYDMYQVVCTSRALFYHTIKAVDDPFTESYPLIGLTVNDN